MSFIVNNVEANELMKRWKADPDNSKIIDEVVNKIVIPVAGVVGNKFPPHLQDDLKQEIILHFLTYKDSFMKSYRGGNCFRFFSSSFWQQASNISKKHTKQSKKYKIVSMEGLDKLTKDAAIEKFQGMIKSEYEATSNLVVKLTNWCKTRFLTEIDTKKAAKYVENIIKNKGKKDTKVPKIVLDTYGNTKVKLKKKVVSSNTSKGIKGLSYNTLVHLTSRLLRDQKVGPLTRLLTKKFRYDTHD